MSSTRKYQISGGDDGAYGPSFGPVESFEIDVIHGSDGTSYQLVQLLSPISTDELRIEYFVLAPRYKGDDMKKLRNRGCVVAIARVLPGQLENVQAGHISEAVEYWAVGKIKPIAS